MNIPTQNAGTFSFHGIGGLSSDDFKLSGNTYTETTKTDVGAVGVSHLIRLNGYYNENAQFYILIQSGLELYSFPAESQSKGIPIFVGYFGPNFIQPGIKISTHFDVKEWQGMRESTDASYQ